MNGIILDSHEFPCAAPVLTYKQTGLEFKAGRGARRRADEIDIFVVHWTGAENEPPIMFKTLEKRKLGIEFAFTRAQTAPGFSSIYQFADPILIDTFDAGPINRRSAGAELTNFGWRNPRKLWMIPKLGKDRELYKTEWAGRKPTYARFFPWQLNSLVALLDTIISSGLTKIDRKVPTERGELLRRVMTPAEIAAFSGVLGHNHVNPNKADPGTDAMEHLLLHGYK